MRCDENKVEALKKRAGALGSVLGLDNMQNLMEELDNIQERLAVIHVAGTNGKGSTCAMLERILCLGGYRTGRYSSPAVFCEEEKYQVCQVAITDEELKEIFGEIEGACERLTRRGLPHPTLFEIETAAAFLWFYRKKCQIVLLETGLGGRLDATNIIKKPLCSVITTVSMDHMAFLGDTLEKIAWEKAGIIKEGCPVITAWQQPEVYQVLDKVCREKGADLQKAAVGEITKIHYEDKYLCFDWEGFRDLKLSLIGSYQIENACCVIETVHRLSGLGFKVGDDTIREGLRTTIWPGRFEVLHRSPLLVIDGAHNEAAARKLRETLEMGFTNYEITYIIGVLADKEHQKMLSVMLPLAKKVYTVTPDNIRALPGDELCREACKFHGDVVCAGSVREALKRALADAKGYRQPMILAFGSLSYLGELKGEFEGLPTEDDVASGKPDLE